MQNYSKIIDISLPIHEGMITYPDNPQVTMTPEKGETTSRTIIKMGSHTGTHIDAPLHVVVGGVSIDNIDLSVFVGQCRVLDASEVEFGSGVDVDFLQRHDIKEGERILFKTRNSERGFEQFYDDYVYIDGDAANYLAEREVALVGVDSLSIKQRGSKDVRPHTALLEKGIPILEGLDLSQAEAGDFMLHALPLKFMGIDGSPCRAVLIKN